MFNGYTLLWKIQGIQGGTQGWIWSPREGACLRYLSNTIGFKAETRVIPPVLDDFTGPEHLAKGGPGEDGHGGGKLPGHGFP